MRKCLTMMAIVVVLAAAFIAVPVSADQPPSEAAALSCTAQTFPVLETITLDDVAGCEVRIRVCYCKWVDTGLPEGPVCIRVCKWITIHTC